MRLVLLIFNIIAIPIINKTEMNTIIPSKTFNVPPKFSITFTIFESAIGSLTAETRLYIILKIVNFIIGPMHIPIITITPINPTAFFITDVAP